MLASFVSLFFQFFHVFPYYTDMMKFLTGKLVVKRFKTKFNKDDLQ